MSRRENDFRRYFYGDFPVPPAMPWACRNCGRGYIARTEDGKCAVCEGMVKKIPYVEPKEDEE